MIREGVEVSQLLARDGRVDRVRTSAGDIAADVVVLAGGAWSASLTRDLRIRLPVLGGKGYSIDVFPHTMPSRPIILIDAHVACSPLGDRLRIAGTMEFSGTNLRVDARRVAAIERAVRPLVGTCRRLTSPWAGLRPIAPDGLPVIGAAPGFENVFLATAYSMLGMTVSPAAGALLAEEIATGRKPVDLIPFAPNRFSANRRHASRLLITGANDSHLALPGRTVGRS